MHAPLYHVETPEMLLAEQLAGEAVISSSQVSVKGPLGSGRRHLVRILQRKSKLIKKDGAAAFPWKVHRYTCLGGTDPKALFVDLITTLKPDEVIVASNLPRLVRQLAEVLVAGGAGLLYLGNAHCLSKNDRENIQEAVELVREEQPLGVVLTSLCDQPQLDDILSDPTSLADIQLKPLKLEQTFGAIQVYDSRFEPWAEAFKEKESEARELALTIHGHTVGNFERLAALCRSIRHHMKGDKIEAKELTKLIGNRGRR